MALQLLDITKQRVGNIFGISANDGEVLGFYGNKRIPQSSGGEKNLLFDDFDGAALDTAKWDETTTGSGNVSVGSGVCVLATNATLNSIVQIQSDVRSLRQIVAGDITFETRMKVVKGNDGWFKVGLKSIGAEGSYTDYAFIGGKLNNTPLATTATFIANSGTTGTGTVINITSGTYFKLKIVVGLYNVKYYVNDVLHTTISTADSIPNDQEIFAYFHGRQGGGGGWNVTMTIDWVKFQYIGSG